jgi:hypothetical protein
VRPQHPHLLFENLTQCQAKAKTFAADPRAPSTEACPQISKISGRWESSDAH